MLNFRKIAMGFLTLVFAVDFISAQVVAPTQVIAPIDSSTVIVTPVPAPKEVIVEPAGPIQCTETPARWYNGVWHTGYKTCRYAPGNPAFQGEAWIAGHWSCTQYNIVNNQATCTNWDWVAGGWVSRYEEVPVQ